MTTLMLTGINALLVVANVGMLAITIKVYSEVLKIQHIQRIGKKAPRDEDAVVR